MSNVIDLPVITKLDLNPDRVLSAAIGKLSEVILCGFDKDGDFYFASSKANSGDVLYHLEMAKHRLMKICNDE